MCISEWLDIELSVCGLWRQLTSLMTFFAGDYGHSCAQWGWHLSRHGLHAPLFSTEIMIDSCCVGNAFGHVCLSVCQSALFNSCSNFWKSWPRNFILGCARTSSECLSRDRPKFGFGFGAECRQKCGFGLHSASAEVVTGNFGLHSASAVYECLTAECIRPNVYEDTFVNQQLLPLDSHYVACTV